MSSFLDDFCDNESAFPSMSSAQSEAMSTNFIGKMTRRPVCFSCKRPQKVCLCDVFPEQLIDSTITCIILQHPFECKRKKRTDWIAQRIVGRTLIFQGRSVKAADSEILRRALSDPKSCALIFPAFDSQTLPESTDTHSPIKTLFFLDGTWQQAREMFKASPELQEISRFKLALPKNYKGAFLIRKAVAELKDGSEFCPLSTAEAVALAVDEICNSSERTIATRKVLKAFCDKQLSFTKADSIKHRTERAGYIENFYS